jgi:ubiquinone/menaquinone biosynthesis C-methylase UbiE
MPQQADQYFADHASSSSETTRLGGLCKLYDHWTQDCFRMAGLTHGKRVAEVGFGTGSMLRWLSAQVATDVNNKGLVHGYDLTSRFIGGNRSFLEQDHVELFEHNIQDKPLPDNQYDFVYTRLMLSHLINPRAAIKNMIAGLKPGGKFVALDFASLVVQAASDADTEFNDAVEKTNQLIGAEGLLSASFGAEMKVQMDDVGLIDITDSIMVSYFVGGDFGSLISAEGMDLIGQA